MTTRQPLLDLKNYCHKLPAEVNLIMKKETNLAKKKLAELNF